MEVVAVYLLFILLGSNHPTGQLWYACMENQRKVDDDDEQGWKSLFNNIYYYEKLMKKIDRF